MGKKPVVGLVGLCWVGLALCGCQTTRNKDTAGRYTPGTTFSGSGQVAAQGTTGQGTTNASFGGTTGAGSTTASGTAAAAYNNGSGGVTAGASGAYNNPTGASGLNAGISGNYAASAGPAPVKVSGEGSFSNLPNTSVPPAQGGSPAGGTGYPSSSNTWGGTGSAGGGVGSTPPNYTSHRQTDPSGYGPTGPTSSVDPTTSGRTTSGIQQMGYTREPLSSNAGSNAKDGFDRLPNPPSSGRPGMGGDLGGKGDMIPSSSASVAPPYGTPLPPSIPDGSMSASTKIQASWPPGSSVNAGAAATSAPTHDVTPPSAVGTGTALPGLPGPTASATSGTGAAGAPTTSAGPQDPPPPSPAYSAGGSPASGPFRPGS